MPLQLPQWTDYLTCPVCRREFGSTPRCPISLGCGHTICKHCLANLHTKQCPYDQTKISSDLEDLPVNTALLQLVEVSSSKQAPHLPLVKALSEEDRIHYNTCIQCIEELARYLKYTGNGCIGRLSRPMQKKLVTLVQCAVLEEEGRGRAYRTARSLGERIVVELILYHQNPQQLTANLWAAIRARGCQFLGPAMQEEVLKLVLLALEDGSALSRKVLVMFIVQRLEPHFPQASKTSIGHVVQLLYRASCFKVSKRESESSLMQLKEEFRGYEALRREHDAQLVQMAWEAGVRIAPDQWSALLYGDGQRKSHMQSIVDKLQTPSAFAQAVRELVVALQRSGDPRDLLPALRPHLDRLAQQDPNPDAKPPSLQTVAAALEASRAVVVGFSQFMWQQMNNSHPHQGPKTGLPKLPPSMQNVNENQIPGQSPQTKNWQRATSAPPAEAASAASPAAPSAAAPGAAAAHAQPHSHKLYKVLMCRDTLKYGACPRGGSCTYAHSDAELDMYRNKRNSTAASQMMKPVNNIPATRNEPIFGVSPIRIQDGNMETIAPISSNPLPYNPAGPSMMKPFPGNQPPAPAIHTSPLNFNQEMNYNDIANGLPGNMNSQCNISGYPPGANVPYTPPKYGEMNTLQKPIANSNGYIAGVCQHTKENMYMNSMKNHTGNTDINMATLYDKRNNVMDQLASTSSLQDMATELEKNFTMNSVSSLHHTPSSFVRSDSILADDEFVPYDEPPISKFGPISRLSRERPTGLPTMSNLWNKTTPVDNAFNGNFCTSESVPPIEETHENSATQKDSCFICQSLLDVCEAQSSSQGPEFAKKTRCLHRTPDRENQNDPRIFCLSCSQNGECGCQKAIYSKRQPVPQYMRDGYGRREDSDDPCLHSNDS